MELKWFCPLASCYFFANLVVLHSLSIHFQPTTITEISTTAPHICWPFSTHSTTSRLHAILPLSKTLAALEHRFLLQTSLYLLMILQRPLLGLQWAGQRTTKSFVRRVWKVVDKERFFWQLFHPLLLLHLPTSAWWTAENIITCTYCFAFPSAHW